jgi:hypothetical protein
MQTSMPPTSDGVVRTVACALTKLVISPLHLQKIQEAVATTHKATIFASELINMHIRRILQADRTADLSCCFNANWVDRIVSVAVSQKYRHSVSDEVGIDEFSFFVLCIGCTTPNAHRHSMPVVMALYNNVEWYSRRSTAEWTRSAVGQHVHHRFRKVLDLRTLRQAHAAFDHTGWTMC